MLVDDLPKPRGVRVIGHALEHQGRGAVGERPIDDVAVPGHPADIGGAPVDLAVAVVEDVFVGHRRVDEIAAGGVQHPFRLPGRPRGVEDEQRVLGRHLLRRAVGRGGGAGLVIPDVAAFDPVDGTSGVADDDDLAHFRAMEQGVVGIALERDRAAAAPPFVGGDQHRRATIADASRQAVGEKPPKTTEWIAPMRAQASIATAISGIIGR